MFIYRAFKHFNKHWNDYLKTEKMYCPIYYYMVLMNNILLMKELISLLLTVYYRNIIN